MRNIYYIYVYSLFHNIELFNVNHCFFLFKGPLVRSARESWIKIVLHKQLNTFGILRPANRIMGRQDHCKISTIKQSEIFKIYIKFLLHLFQHLFNQVQIQSSVRGKYPASRRFLCDYQQCAVCIIKNKNLCLRQQKF